MQFLTVLFSLSIMTSVFSGCSDGDPEPGCYQEQNRKIIKTISNVVGTIRGSDSHSCSNDYIIELDEKLDGLPLGLLSPCNLSEEFHKNGMTVIFSGNVYESFETEDICADFFELTNIKLSNP
mgnify:CR=1 FL=1